MRLIEAGKLEQALVEERNKIPLTIPCAPYELTSYKMNRAGQFQRSGIRKALRVLNEQPTVEALPVVHGRWIPTYHTYYNRDGACQIADEWRCSECKVRMEEEWNYCPNCGAKMDGGKEDASD